jgi:hypothetical protein
MTKPRLSGAQWRKRKRQREEAERKARLGGGNVRLLSPENLPPVRIEDLNTVSAYRTELNRVYGQMRAGDLLPEVATKMAFVLCQGAGLARIEQELREAALIREQLIKLNGGSAIELLPAHADEMGSSPSATDSSPITIEGHS